MNIVFGIKCKMMWHYENVMKLVRGLSKDYRISSHSKWPQRYNLNIIKEGEGEDIR